MKTIFVVPTYNEAENVRILVEAISALKIPELSLLIVDDNSPDGTGDIADELHEQLGEMVNVLHRKGKEGLAKAYIQGLDFAIKDSADCVGMMDADLSHPPEKIPEMISAIENADLVIGSRYTKGGGLDKDWPIWRKALSRFGNLYSKIILGLPMNDATGGFKLWKKDALEGIPFRESSFSGYLFQVEQAYLAKIKNYRVKEIPIYFAERQHGVSKMSFRIQVEAAVGVWKIRQKYQQLR